MSYKIAMIGAGSVVFSRNLTGDLLHHDAFKDATFSYMDVDTDRLDVGARLCRKAADAMGLKPTIEQTTDRREAIKDADFVVCMVQIGGFDATLVDFEIPRKYGLNFTIADTTGPGGLFRALRTFPFMRDLARDIMDVARPDCWLLNYSNPMSMNMKSLFHTSGERATGRGGVKAVGLCHSVQGTFSNRMRDIGVDPADAAYECSGINHMSFFTKLRHKQTGEDLYPKLFAVADEKIAEGRDAVRYEIMKRLGYAVTESSEHNAEYCAHFMPHDGLIEKFKVPVDEYLRRCDGIVDEFQRLVDFARSDEPMDPAKVRKSHEYGSDIANAIVTGEPAVVYGNMLNDGAIPNLPATAIVETPTLVDGNGCRLTRVAPVEPQLLAYMMPHVCQHELFLEAAIDGRRDKVYQAAICDPLTAAKMPMDKIVEMCDELIAAHGLEKDGGTLPDLDRTASRVPGSGKQFSPPTPAELRASWEAAKTHTSNEDVVERWHLLGPAETDEDPAAVADALADHGRVHVGDGWTPADVPEGKEAVVVGEVLGLKWKSAPAYAYAEVDSVHDRETNLRVPSGERISIWLNGQQVHTGRGVGKTIPVQLKQGDNALLVKLHNPDHSTKLAAFLGKPNF